MEILIAFFDKGDTMEILLAPYNRNLCSMVSC